MLDWAVSHKPDPNCSGGRGFSSPQAVVSGVPQGTVLGPKLFLLYINDLLPTLKNCKGLCFADNIKLISKILDTESTARLQEDLCRVIDWSTMNNMELP